jgi:hypothetical protein
MAKKPTKADRGARLKLDVSWEDAARTLLRTPAKSTPRRAVKTRKKSKR